MKKTNLIITIAALLVACSGSPDLSRVTTGMPAADVEAAVGKPREVRHLPFGIEWWMYGDNELVVMQGGTVTKVVTDAKGDMRKVNEALEEASSEMKATMDSFEAQVRNASAGEE